MAIRPRSIGELLDGAFRLYKQDIGLYMFTAIVASLPLAFAGILTFGGAMVGDMAGEASQAAVVQVIVLYLVALVATIAVWTALMIQMNERLEGREPQLGPSVARALALVLRVAWGVVIAYFFLVVTILAVSLVFGLVAALAGMVLPQVGLTMVMGVTGIGLFLVVFVYLFAGLALFLPGVVVERLTAYQSIKRGFALAKASQFRIVSVVFLSWVLIAVPVIAVSFLTGTAGAFLDPDAISTGITSTGQIVVQQLLAVAASGFTTPFMVACILLLYYDQRVRREAFDLQAEADALAL